MESLITAKRLSTMDTKDTRDMEMAISEAHMIVTLKGKIMRQRMTTITKFWGKVHRKLKQ